MNYEKAIANIRKELKNYIEKHNIKSLILGVSGGMDSCLCAALAKPVCDELGIPLIGRSLPIQTNAPDEIHRANLTGKAFCTEFEEEQLGEIYNQISIINNDMGHDPTSAKAYKIRNGNIKARLRMIYLYNLASLNNGMVLSTDNYTEYLLGFWTLHGDVGDYGMIQNLYKSEVYDMAEYIMNNEYDIKGKIRTDAYYAIKRTIEALATDGLGVTNLGDLGQILPEWKGSSRDGYKEVDRILQIWTEDWKESISKWKVIKQTYGEHPVVQRHVKSQFKRDNPYNIPRNLIEE